MNEQKTQIDSLMCTRFPYRHRSKKKNKFFFKIKLQPFPNALKKNDRPTAKKFEF